MEGGSGSSGPSTPPRPGLVSIFGSGNGGIRGESNNIAGLAKSSGASYASFDNPPQQ